MKKDNTKRIVVSSLILFLVAIVVAPKVNFIAEKLGLSLPPKWIQDINDYIANGLTITEAFLLITGIAVPGWLAALTFGFGLVSA